MKTMFRLLAIGLIGVCFSTTAFAQEYETSGDGGIVLSTSTTSGGLSTTGGLVLTLVMVAGSGGSAVLDRYVKDNTVALNQGLMMGSGESVADLAQLFQIESKNQDAFGKLLQANRKTLIPLVNTTKIERKNVLKFKQVVFAALQKDVRFKGAVVKLSKIN